MNRIGRSAASRISSRWIEVSGTSAVGMHHRSSRSIAVGVVGELGQLAGGGERLAGDQGGRPDLLELVGVAVERVLAQGPGQGGAALALHGEHGARDLHGPLVVEDAVAGAELPVRDALVLAVAVGVEADDAHDGVVGVAGAVGRVGVGRVGDAQQEVADLGGHGGGLGGQLALLLAERPALGLGGRGLVGLALLVEQADLLRERLDLGPQLVALASRGARWRSSSSATGSMSAVSMPRRASAAFTASGSVRMRRMSSMGHDGTRPAPTGADYGVRSSLAT